MGREIRRVPANWEHPKDGCSRSSLGYKPLRDGSWAALAKRWDEENAAWEAGTHPDKTGRDYHYDQWAGGRPMSDEYMPDWPAEERTHYQIYEDTTEGTPVSPVFATAEECARWCADNGASMFGHMTASYEDWLSIASGGSSPGLVLYPLTGETEPLVIGPDK